MADAVAVIRHNTTQRQKSISLSLCSESGCDQLVGSSMILENTQSSTTSHRPGGRRHATHNHRQPSGLNAQYIHVYLRLWPSMCARIHVHLGSHHLLVKCTHVCCMCVCPPRVHDVIQHMVYMYIAPSPIVAGLYVSLQTRKAMPACSMLALYHHLTPQG